MSLYSNPSLDEAIVYIIQKDKSLIDKSSLLNDMKVINDMTTSKKAKLEAFERLITYLSHLTSWDEELITYLGNRFIELKLKETS